MEEILASPAWHALNSGNKSLGFGNEKVKYFAGEVSPFAALVANTDENFQLLYEIHPGDRPALFMSEVEISIPEPWQVLAEVKAIQMVCKKQMQSENGSAIVVPLLEKHIPQMLELTRLTNPGPFAKRTIEFGHYAGIFEDEQLVAMAGQRLLAYDHAEISAVCTHPDHTGKGYAQQLMAHQVKRIFTEGNIPYLHVRHDNVRAIKVYENAGFCKSRDMYFYVLKKELK